MALSYKVKTKTKAKPNKKMLGLYTYTTPNIVVVGDKKLRSQMDTFEQNFNVDLVFVKPKHLPKVIGKQTIAVVIDEKKLGRKSKIYTETVLANYKMTPVFFLARKARKDKESKSQNSIIIRFAPLRLCVRLSAPPRAESSSSLLFLNPEI